MFFHGLIILDYQRYVLSDHPAFRGADDVLLPGVSLDIVDFGVAVERDSTAHGSAHPNVTIARLDDILQINSKMPPAYRNQAEMLYFRLGSSAVL